MPGDFLPIAERTGAIRAVTETVLLTATRQCAEWQRERVKLRVSVNLAASDLLNAALPDAVGDILERTGLDADLLHLEITEHGIVVDHAVAGATLDALRALGVGVSVDDFGTGYASIAYVRDLPICGLKIDQSFVRGIVGSAQDAAIVHSTIDLGHTLGLRVVAEGVEDFATLRRVREWGVDAVQGFLIGVPVDGAAIPAVARLARTRRGPGL
jgi:EAL domain-containing protein (putative c-di-GMP-specific phosphodiesterase class I)